MRTAHINRGPLRSKPVEEAEQSRTRHPSRSCSSDATTSYTLASFDRIVNDITTWSRVAGARAQARAIRVHRKNNTRKTKVLELHAQHTTRVRFSRVERERELRRMILYNVGNCSSERRRCTPKSSCPSVGCTVALHKHAHLFLAVASRPRGCAAGCTVI